MANDSGSRSGSRGSLRTVPTRILHQELDKRRQRAMGLEKLHRSLQSKLGTIDRRIKELGFTPAVLERTRPVSTKWRTMPVSDITLRDAICKAIDSKTMSITSIIIAVKKLGYKTKSTPHSFRAMVTNRLTEKTGHFICVRRGMYTTSPNLRRAA